MNDISTVDTAIVDRLVSIFRSVFDDDSLVIQPSTSASDIPDWDSQTHIILILAVEQEFGVRFRTSELDLLRNVGDFVKLIGAKLEKRE
jgi:acyl carrier protein